MHFSAGSITHPNGNGGTPFPAEVSVEGAYACLAGCRLYRPPSRVSDESVVARRAQLSGAMQASKTLEALGTQ